MSRSRYSNGKWAYYTLLYCGSSICALPSGIARLGDSGHLPQTACFFLFLWGWATLFFSFPDSEPRWLRGQQIKASHRQQKLSMSLDPATHTFCFRINTMFPPASPVDKICVCVSLLYCKCKTIDLMETCFLRFKIWILPVQVTWWPTGVTGTPHTGLWHPTIQPDSGWLHSPAGKQVCCLHCTSGKVSADHDAFMIAYHQFKFTFVHLEHLWIEEVFRNSAQTLYYLQGPYYVCIWALSLMYICLCGLLF